MRLQRGTDVCGLDPQVARTVVRHCHGRFRSTADLAERAGMDPAQFAPHLAALEDEGYLSSEPEVEDGTLVDYWRTTVRGGALANASLLKPISRARAETLLAEALDRVRGYNADPGKPYWIDRVTVFGSFLDPDAADLGDLDLHVAVTARGDSPQALLDYARRSGRRFSSYFARLGYAEQDAARTVKGGSRHISVHKEDISRFTDRSQVVYARDADG